jgi:hypothetical protein
MPSVALLLRNSKAFQNVLSGSIRSVRAKIVSGIQRGYQRYQLLRVAANLLWIYQEWAVRIHRTPLALGPLPELA